MGKSLDTKIQYIKGVGPNKAKLFHKIGVDTIEDLFYHFPRRYVDRSNLMPISEVKVGDEPTIKANVLAVGKRQSWRRKGFSILEVIVGDDTGKITCVWFNQPYLENYFRVNQGVILHGKIEVYSGRLQMNSPEFEILFKDTNEADEYDKLTPVYTLPEGMTQRFFRNILKKGLGEYLPGVVDSLPYDIRERNKLLNLAKSLRDIHFPPDLNQPKESYRRLAFEEFFLFQIPILLRKLRKKQRKGIAHKVEGRLVKEFLKNLPFKLTQAQERVIEEIKQDMGRPLVMNRLLQGDVGSGKTIVALFASLFAIQGGYQVAFMVPTELLAEQHYQNSIRLLNPVRNLVKKYSKDNISNGVKSVNIVLLIGSLSKDKKARIYNEIKKGKAQLIIGTHSLLEEKLEFKELGLVVIDEQHKFGVTQRSILPKKGINPVRSKSSQTTARSMAETSNGVNPDVLIMTATPIPRTLAITIYGDLDISVIDELPPQRKPVRTELFTEDRRQEIYKFIEEKVKQGRQVYIIYPIIEESYVLDLRAANQMYNILKKEIFPQFNIGLVHGQLDTREQNKIMSEFKSGKIYILVATTVLEVGIDVPNASVMIVEHAERFGLSQLHQLRGRIGRGEYDSYCILISEPKSKEAQMRIEAMVENSDGFRIAEEDLKIRGPGQFFGERQHGLSELRIANPLSQLQLLKRARQEARNLVSSDPNLELRQNQALGERLKIRFPGYNRFITE